MMREKFAALLLVGALATGLGCSSAEEEEAGEVTAEGVDPRKNPLGALGSLASLGSDLEQFQKELDEMPDVETVSYEVLIEALPEPPSGWTATEPEGQTNTMGDFKTSVAKRTYKKEGSDAQATVEVHDWAYNKAVYLPFLMAAKFSQESTSGYNRGITIDDEHPAREQYQNQGQSGQREVLYAKRYFVRIALRNLPPDAFDDWWQRVQVSELPRQ